MNLTLSIDVDFLMFVGGAISLGFCLFMVTGIVLGLIDWFTGKWQARQYRKHCADIAVLNKSRCPTLYGVTGNTRRYHKVYGWYKFDSIWSVENNP